MADVPQDSFFGSETNSTPRSFRVLAVAKASSLMKESG
jgi:hypothetical protein